MDLQRPPFLAGHTDLDACSYEVSSGEAIVNGVLRAPAQRCTFIARTPWSDAPATARFRLELDMHVPELAELDVRLEDLRETPLTALWIDDDVRAAWNEIVDDDTELALRDGSCVFIGKINAGELRRMTGIVAV